MSTAPEEEFIPTHKIETRCRLIVPKVGKQIGEDADSVVLEPPVIESTLTRNSWKDADELTLVLDWRDAGVDPRFVSNAVVAFWMWDSNREDYDDRKHLRFVGVVKRPARKLSGDDMRVEISFQDYTALFLAAKPFPADVLTWRMTPQAAFEAICDSTGWYDVEKGEIVSSVAALRGRLEFRLSDPSRAERTLGDAVPERFHRISKPVPPNTSDAWAAWLYVVNLAGLMTYVELDKVIVTDTTEHFAEDDAPTLFWGEDILTLEDHHDTTVAARGILLRSFDPLTGQLIEALYPPPGDPRIKAKRATAKNPTGQPTFDELASHYDVQNYAAIVDQATLHRRAKEAWELQRREELEGTLTTAECRLFNANGDAFDVFDLFSGDPIAVHVDVDAETLDRFDSDDQRVSYLRDDLGLSEGVAKLRVSNRAAAFRPVYHVKNLTVTHGPERFEVRIDYLSKIHLQGE